MNDEEILIPLVLFISVGAVMITYITARHRERMAMVEKGMAGEDIKAMYARNIHFGPLTSLKWGILFIFIGAAIMFGNFLHEQFRVDEGVIIGMVSLFAGIALLIFYNIASKKSSQV